MNGDLENSAAIYEQGSAHMFASVIFTYCDGSNSDRRRPRQRRCQERFSGGIRNTRGDKEGSESCESRYVVTSSSLEGDLLLTG